MGFSQGVENAMIIFKLSRYIYELDDFIDNEGLLEA